MTAKSVPVIYEGNEKCLRLNRSYIVVTVTDHVHVGSPWNEQNRSTSLASLIFAKVFYKRVRAYVFDKDRLIWFSLCPYFKINLMVLSPRKIGDDINKER